MATKDLFTQYFKDLHAVDAHGDAREESFYGPLKSMLGAVAEDTGRKHISVTTLPKSTDAGNPDFRVWNGTDRIVGYIEAKKPTEGRLDEIEQSEQLKRYRATFPNLILTNFLEFRLYRDGQRVDEVLAAQPFVMNGMKTAPPVQRADELAQLLDKFLGFSLPKTFTAESLAVELAKRTRFMRDVVAKQLEYEAGEPGVLSGFYEAFQTYLIGSLTPADFADLFAQTITYGLFAARTRAGEQFSRRAAFDNIPHSIGVLRDLFHVLSLGDIPQELEWCVDDIAEVLAVADAPGILDRYYHQHKGRDPIVHFYETFLAQYDPATRERRGVYYTPEPVVGYIVRSLHEILKTDFGKPDGLASEGVTLLDPAAGTMTFIARAAQVAVDEFTSKYGSGGREDFIRRHIIKNFYAFELMMAPYAVGHLKMGFFLEELGHRLTEDERMPFYLTNTLDDEVLEQSRLPGMAALADESRLAAKVKKEAPILVVLGNPPYSFSSSNKGPWISELIEDYKTVDGLPMKDKKIGVIQDDYVKFLRFAQWKIDAAGRGVVGMITNNSYLDSVTFRGMRQSLMKTFDDIYVLDLHGNALKKETCPDGSPDKNVFDIRQGVAIVFLIKHGGRQRDTTVRHADSWGLRDRKYAWLDQHTVEDTPWQELTPSGPYHLFVTRNDSLEADYVRSLNLPTIFMSNGSGLVTRKDDLAIQLDRDTMWTTVQRFAHLAPESARAGYGLGEDGPNWSVANAQRDLKDSGLSRDRVAPVLYRPFDVRYTYYTGRSNGFLSRPCHEVMRHMLTGENLALIAPRQHKDEFGALAASTIGGHKTVAAYDINYYFPLYLYPDSDRQDLFAQLEPAGRRPNLDPAVMQALAAAYGKEPSPEDVFYYLYAVLYAPSYRTKYAEFLRMDFPRVPFAAEAKLFARLAGLGEKLVALHLLKSAELDKPLCRFDGQGDGVVAKGKDGLRYEPGEQRVYINASQYFAPVPAEVFSYQVGGYQVCEKWLKDRRERHLEIDDIRTYCRIVTALARTIELQRDIDALYPQVESKVVEIPG